jgi:hypothetical protein
MDARGTKIPESGQRKKVKGDKPCDIIGKSWNIGRPVCVWLFNRKALWYECKTTHKSSLFASDRRAGIARADPDRRFQLVQRFL